MKNFAVLYVCDLDQVPDFKQMYELYDPVTLMFFFRNKHMMCDFGTGNNNKLNWVLEDKQELIDIIETIYRGAKKGRGLVVSPKGGLCRVFEQRLRSIGGALLTNSRGQIIRPGIDTKWGEIVLVLDCQVCKQEEFEEFETCCKVRSERMRKSNGEKALIV